jgi:hypothetical protein
MGLGAVFLLQVDLNPTHNQSKRKYWLNNEEALISKLAINGV